MPVAVTGGRVELLGAAADIQIIRMGSRTNQPAAWLANLAAVRHACEQLAVADSVRINEVRYDRGRWAGMHTWANSEHIVSIARWCSPEYASRVLWHELTHASQSERLGPKAFEADYAFFGRKGQGYRTNPYELEARANEDMHDTLPLTL